jgi:hypothetical protein
MIITAKTPVLGESLDLHATRLPSAASAVGAAGAEVHPVLWGAIGPRYLLGVQILWHWCRQATTPRHS